MTGKRLVVVGVFALLCASGCGDGSTVEPVRALTTGPAFDRATNPPAFEGEKIQADAVINTLYDWDVGADGPVVYASRPMGPARWPEHNNPQSTDFIYVVVYPVGTTVTGLMCYDTPRETCPDHGPVIAAGVMQIDPAIYGQGVLGHDHMQPKNPGAHAWAAFVLFTNAAAANRHITSKAQVEAAVAAGDAFIVPEPALTFHNAPVNEQLYRMATPWICPAYTACAP